MKPRELPLPALDALVHEAEAERVLQICNACRYCEGFCAVFPAMARRLAFPAADVHYLANLCHGCGACLHACQYAPPHQFAVNVPRALAQVRRDTYEQFAWPRALGAAYRRHGAVLAVALALGLAVFLALGAAAQGSLFEAPRSGGFYAIFPHGLMVGLFAPVFAFALLALAIGVVRFWRGQSPGLASAVATAEAARHALTLKHLDGGHGEGCPNDDDAWTHARRRCHHLTFHGFLLCFAATSVATVYHYALGWPAPYAWTSLPKLLGMAGGLALAAGTAGLGWLRLKRHPQHVEPSQRALDIGFIALLFGTAVSGLLLAVASARGSAAMPLLLCLHLGTVMALFATLPYGKFAHAAYRVAALLKASIERRQPMTLKLGSE